MRSLLFQDRLDFIRFISSNVSSNASVCITIITIFEIIVYAALNCVLLVYIKSKCAKEIFYLNSEILMCLKSNYSTISIIIIILEFWCSAFVFRELSGIIGISLAIPELTQLFYRFTRRKNVGEFNACMQQSTC